MKIGIDVMGGDYAPKSTIEGAISARQELPNSDKIVLIGDESIIHSQLSQCNEDSNHYDIIHASEVIDMAEHPLKAFKTKSKSSINIGFRMLKEEQIDAFSSAGNSGAILIGSIYSLSTISGIIRPCIAGILPKENGGISIFLDVGINPDPKPDVMYQFAILGSIYGKFVHGIDNPKVGLLNIGEEEEKGNLLSQTAYQLMKGSKDFNFIGNIEGRDFLNDKADIVVCDGFTGNVVLKQMESMYQFMTKRGLNDDFVKRFNYEIYGGTPVLGINSSVVVGHGISSALAVKNMILLSKEIKNVELSQKIFFALKN
jgi:glycerol-3-phosphate acyltransferase PlsX